MKSLDPIAERFGVRERKTDVLTKKQCVIGFDRLCVQQARELGQIIVREDLRGVLVEEPRRGQNIKPFVAIEVQDVADAVQNFTAYAAVARFQPAERAVVDLSQTGDLLLRQTALIAEARQ